jgi:hypothetical protein
MPPERKATKKRRRKGREAAQTRNKKNQQQKRRRKGREKLHRHATHACLSQPDADHEPCHHIDGVTDMSVGCQPQPVADIPQLCTARVHSRSRKALLTLAHDHGIAVLLDVHQDAVGTAVCGEGVPQWYSAIATPHEIGKPLTPVEKLKDGTCGEEVRCLEVLCAMGWFDGATIIIVSIGLI